MMEKFCGILLLIITTAFNAVLVDAACPVNYVEIAGGCYLLLDNIEATFSEARSICEDFNGDLAIVDDCNVLGALTDYFAAAGVTATSIWIGGTDVAVEGSWQWINGASMAMGAPFWGRIWGEDYNYEPDNRDSEDCAAMSYDAGYYFQDRPCDSLLSPICQIAPAGAQLSLANYWVGGSDLEVEGAWKWINGESMRMGVPFWGKNDGSALQPENAEGGEHCLTLCRNDRYYFNDEKCHLLRPMLCQTAVV